MTYCTSLFSQILSLLPRSEFAHIVRDHRGERYAKSFSCWDQLVAMLFCQLGQAHSLREICGGLATCLGKLSHLGLREAPRRSTLAHANKTRSWEMFRDLFYVLLEKAQREWSGPRKFRFKNKLYSLDSSVIDLCVTLFDWAKFRRTKGAVKLHLLLDHDGYLPVFAHITDGKSHDIHVARTLRFAPGSIVAMDRAYVDYALFGQWSERGVFFVTRLKSNAVYDIVQEWEPPQHSNVLGDYTIRFTSNKGLLAGGRLYRVVFVWDEANQRELALLTNHLDFGATTIASIYKERWQIEIFFKTIKQNLKVKTFVGTSANALKIQLWTALIAILMLKILQFRSQIVWSLSNLVALLRFNLFTYRDLWAWLNDPFRTPLHPPAIQQLTFDSILTGQQQGA